MNTLTLKAEKIDNKLYTNKSIFKELKWYKNPNNIFYTILSLISIPMFAFIGNNLFPLVFLIWSGSVAILLFTLFNYINKLKCKKYKVKGKGEGIFWTFSKNEFQKKMMKLSYEKMVSKNVLFDNKEDVSRLKKIEDDILNSMVKPTNSYLLQVLIIKTWPIVMALFITYVGVFLNQSKNLMEDSKLLLSYTILLFCFISQILFSHDLIIDILNSKYRKQQRFLKRITELKTYLSMKYQK